MSHLKQASGGFAILLSKQNFYQSYGLEEVMKSSLMVGKAKYECFNFVFVNECAPNTGRVGTNQDVLGECDTEKFLFLGGGFNCMENNKLEII